MSKTSQVQQAARQLVRFWLDYLARQVVQGQAAGEWRQEMDPWRAVYRLYGLYLADQVFNDLELCQDPARHFWPEVDALRRGASNVSCSIFPISTE